METVKSDLIIPSYIMRVVAKMRNNEASASSYIS